VTTIRQSATASVSEVMSRTSQPVRATAESAPNVPASARQSSPSQCHEIGRPRIGRPASAAAAATTEAIWPAKPDSSPV